MSITYPDRHNLSASGTCFLEVWFLDRLAAQHLPTELVIWQACVVEDTLPP